MDSQSDFNAKGKPCEAAGQGMGLFSPDDLVHSYTRAEAFEDGYLVDVSEVAKEAGFKWPVALTRAVWEDCVAWSDEDTTRKGVPQDESGRLWDVLWMARCAGRRSTDGADSVAVELFRVPREGRGTKPRRVTLRATCHGGDDGEPVITIMQPGED